MSRNPVVGRQGPTYHAAAIPGEAEAKAVSVKQVRSEIGHAETMRRTLRALGLRHHQQTVRLPNTASIRGMLYKVRHLIEVTPGEAKEQDKGKRKKGTVKRSKEKGETGKGKGNGSG